MSERMDWRMRFVLKRAGWAETRSVALPATLLLLGQLLPRAFGTVVARTLCIVWVA